MVPFSCFFFFFCLSGTYNIFKSDHIGGEIKQYSIRKQEWEKLGIATVSMGFPAVRKSAAAATVLVLLFPPWDYYVMVSPAASY